MGWGKAFTLSSRCCKFQSQGFPQPSVAASPREPWERWHIPPAYQSQNNKLSSLPVLLNVRVFTDCLGWIRLKVRETLLVCICSDFVTQWNGRRKWVAATHGITAFQGHVIITYKWCEWLLLQICAFFLQHWWVFSMGYWSTNQATSWSLLYFSMHAHTFI